MNIPDPPLAAGTLLIAPPVMPDPNFRRTVVFLCEHSEQGSFGLILNRPLTLHVHELLDGLERYADPVAMGGPVQPNTLHFLHRLGDQMPDAVEVIPGVYWGGDFETLKHLIEENPPSVEALRFFIGYAGWASGQLEEEVRRGDWIMESGHDALVFDHRPDLLWRTLLRQKGGEFALLSNFPDDPRMN
jgi:putative transcriptional regulator